MRTTKTLFFVFTALVFATLNSCRYKDNKSISLLSVKKRLCREWILKEAADQNWTKISIENNKQLNNQELSFSRLKDDSLLLDINRTYITKCILQEHKTEISWNQPAKFRITKLTQKELWMEVENFQAYFTSREGEILNLKYTAK